MYIYIYIVFQKTASSKNMNIHISIGGWGAAQPGNRFVSFVRAYARSGCLVELDQNVCGLCFSLTKLCL